MIDTFIPPDAWLPEGWQPLVQAVVKVVRVVEHKRKGMTQTSEETAWWVSSMRSINDVSLSLHAGAAWTV